MLGSACAYAGARGNREGLNGATDTKVLAANFIHEVVEGRVWLFESCFGHGLGGGVMFDCRRWRRGSLQ